MRSFTSPYCQHGIHTNACNSKLRVITIHLSVSFGTSEQSASSRATAANALNHSYGVKEDGRYEVSYPLLGSSCHPYTTIVLQWETP